MPPRILRPPPISSVKLASASSSTVETASSSSAPSLRGSRPFQSPSWMLVCSPISVRGRTGAAPVASSALRLPPVSARLDGFSSSGAPTASAPAPAGVAKTPVEEALAWIEVRLSPAIPRKLRFAFAGAEVELFDRVEGSVPIRDIRFIAKAKLPAEKETLLSDLLRRLLPIKRKVDSGHPSTALFMGPIPTGSLTAPVEVPKIGG